MNQTKQKIFTKAFISVFFTNLSVFTIFYSLIATLPLYAKNMLGRTDDEAGLLVSAFLLSAIIFRPFTGKILDHFGKRRILIFSLVSYLICTILYNVVLAFIPLLILRFLQGIFFSIATTAAGSLAVDHIPVNRSGEGLGYFAMSTNLAVVIGPMIGLPIIQAFSFQTLFITLSVLMFIGSALALMIPNDHVQVEGKMSLRFRLNDLFEIKALPIAVLACLLAFTYASVLSYLSIYAELKDMLALASSFYLVFSLSMVITRPITGRIFDRLGPAYILIPAFSFYFIGLVILAFLSSPVMFIVAGIFFGLGYGGLVPSLQTLAVQSTDRERSGYATATFFTFFDFGIAVGSYLLGIVAVAFGYQNMYLIAAAMTIGILLLYTGLMKRGKTKAA